MTNIRLDQGTDWESNPVRLPQSFEPQSVQMSYSIREFRDLYIPEELTVYLIN